MYKNEIIEFNEQLQRLKLDISCSKGTYIRTIVNDLGEKLGVGAIMCKLTRVEAAGMNLSSALNIETLSKDIIEQNLINPVSILPLKSCEITDNEYNVIINGNKIKNRFNAANEILLVKSATAVSLAAADKNFIQPKKLLN